MVRRPIACLLIFALVAANFSRFFVFAGFELNKAYIAEHLCQNIDKPWLHCEGKCYYIKNMKKADEKEKTGERPSQKNPFQEAVFVPKSGVKFYTQVLAVITIPNHNIVLPLADFPIFQPPQLG